MNRPGQSSGDGVLVGFSERQWIVERGIVRRRDAGQGVLSLHQQGQVVGILKLADQRLDDLQEGVELFEAEHRNGY